MSLNNNEIQESLRSSLNFILDSVSDGGCWRDFDESWNPICTTIITELLLMTGLKETTEWFVRRDDRTCKSFSLKDTFSYLESKICDDGSFGTDFWDACRLAKLIATFDLKDYFPSYEKLHKAILKYVDEDSILAGDSEWKGPGFLAVAIDYLNSIGMENASTKLLDDLTRSQNPDGSWQGILEKSGKPIVSPVWHTAQVIIVLNKIDSIKYKNSIDRAINWLITTQEKNGAWTAIHQYMIYFTSYALIALSIDKSSNEQAIINGYKYLKSRMNSSGRCSDLGGTIMCACALWELSDRKTKHEVSIIDFLINKRANYQVDQLISELKSTQNLYAQVKEKLDEYEEKYKDVVVTITKRWLSYIAIISFILTIIGFIFTIF